MTARPSRASSGRDGMSSSLMLTSSVLQPREAPFADRTDANVAVVSTSVPPAVVSDEMVTQSATGPG